MTAYAFFILFYFIFNLLIFDKFEWTQVIGRFMAFFFFNYSVNNNKIE